MHVDCRLTRVDMCKKKKKKNYEACTWKVEFLPKLCGMWFFHFQFCLQTTQGNVFTGE